MNRNWLVRTRSRQVLGPFNQQELYDQLRQNTFGTEDEIASPGRPWISARTLLNHDFDEVTRTSAQFNTRTINLSKDSEELITPSPSSTNTPTPTRSFTPVEIIQGEPLRSRSVVAHEPWSQPHPLTSPEHLKKQSRILQKKSPLLTAIFLALVIVFIFQMLPKERSSPTLSLATKLGVASDTPFLRNIYELIGRNETAKALEELSLYHQGRPSELDYLIPYAALLIMENHNHDQARSHLDKVLTSQVSNPLKAKAHLWYGYSLLANEEDDFGESHFLESLQLSPNDPATRFNLGRTYIKQQRYAHALDYLQLAEVEVPDLWLIHIYKGFAKTELGKREEARASFRLAIDASPDRWLSYIYYSLFLLGSRDYNEARLTLRKMLTRDPLFEIFSPAPWGFYQEGVDYKEYLNVFSQVMGNTREDEKELGTTFIAFLMNGNGPVENQRLQMLADKGGLMNRVIALGALLRSEPKNDDLRRSLVRLGGNLSEFGPYGYVIRAEAKSRLGNLSEAQVDLNSALLAEPKSAAAHLLQYKLYKVQNKKEEANREIQTILSYHPNYIPAIKALQEL
ncbi:hypothetical protein EBR78_00045 [bacterium]|nr:hypothetical protein [bacterium]NBX81949.1 hypothetical protein [bacterium]